MNYMVLEVDTFLALVQCVGGRVDNFSHFGSKTVTE